MFLTTYVLHAALYFLMGLGIGWSTSGRMMAGVQFGTSILVWGVFVRTVMGWHIAWAVNSVSHVWGYRNYETADGSRNNWLVGLLANGEGWHNNHHAEPRAAAHGHKWWELDVTFLTILALESVGLAKNVVRPSVWSTGSKDRGDVADDRLSQGTRRSSPRVER